MAAASAKKRYQPQTEALPYYAQASPTLLADMPAVPTAPKVSKKDQQDWETLYNHCEQRFQSLHTWRLGHWTTWGQIARYQAPWRYYAFVSANVFEKGYRRDYDIIDRTATLCGEICSAGLMSLLTDPEREWLELGPAIPGFELDRQGKNYYQDVTERLNYVYDHSNFYDAQAQIYDDLTFFGTGVSIDYESETNLLQVFTPCAGEYMLGVGMNNDDDTFYREFRQTVIQTVEMFGIENCPEDIQRMWRGKGAGLAMENVIGHAIEPNFAIEGENGSSIGQVPGGFTWREVYWVRGKKDYKPLSVTGFRENPAAAYRWDTQGNDPYGRGVGEKMLGDTIQLQLETRQKAESIEKVNRPPMGADVSLMNQPSSQNPGKITYMNTNNGGEKKFFPLFEVKPDIPAISADIQLVQDRLARTAYNDTFQRIMTLRQQMNLKADLTATEIDQLTQEAFTRLGPMIGRSYGATRKRIKRHIAILERKGLMPKRPPSLRGVPLNIGLVSLLTEARRAVKTQAITKTVQFVGSIAGEWPEARFKVNPLEAIDLFADGVGAPQKILRTNREVTNMIAQEQKKQAMQQALEQTATGAAAAASLSKTSLAPGTALSALVGPQGAAQ